MVLSLLGSYVNVPLFAMQGTVVALNVGGAIIPILVSLYLLVLTKMYKRMAVGVAVVAAVVHSLAEIVPGPGSRCPFWCRRSSPPVWRCSWRSAGRRRLPTCRDRWAR